MIEIIKGTWAAGETKTFAINGDRVEVLDAQYPLDVFLMNSAGAQLSVMRDSEASFFSAPVGGFSTVQIYSATAQNIRFFVGSGDAGTRRISSVVQVVDGAKARSLAGAAYFISSSLTAAAGQYGQVALYNSAVGQRVVVNSIMVAMSIAGSIEIRQGTAIPGGTQSNGVPKFLGAAAVSFGKKFDALGVSGAGSGIVIGAVSVQANAQLVIPLTEPIVIPANGFLALRSAVDAAVTSVTMQFFEEATT